MTINPREKVNFDRIFKFIQQSDTVIGLFMFRDSATKKTILDRFFSLTIPTQVVFDSVMITATLFVTNFAMLNVILCILMGVTLFFLNVFIFSLIRNKKTFKGLVEWCRGLYDFENKFDKRISKMIENQLIITEKKTVYVIKWFRFGVYADYIAFVIGYPLIGHFLPENIYPKYTLPCPYYLPCEDQKTWIAFGTTLLWQIGIAIG